MTRITQLRGTGLGLKYSRTKELTLFVFDCDFGEIFQDAFNF